MVQTKPDPRGGGGESWTLQILKHRSGKAWFILVTKAAEAESESEDSSELV